VEGLLVDVSFIFNNWLKIGTIAGLHTIDI
jgi:hypothetical protein